MEIGLFQLENLILNRNIFLFLDLRKAPTPVEKLASLLRGTRAVPPRELESYLLEVKHPLSDPVVLICEDGLHSARAAQSLEARGYTNVYVVVGGVEGLLSELDLSTTK